MNNNDESERSNIDLPEEVTATNKSLQWTPPVPKKKDPGNAASTTGAPTYHKAHSDPVTSSSPNREKDVTKVSSERAHATAKTRDVVSRLSKTTANRQEATERKVVGLKNINKRLLEKRQQYLKTGSVKLQEETDEPPLPSVEQLEDAARQQAVTNPFLLLWLGNLAAFKVFFFFLITIESVVCMLVTAGLTVHWYLRAEDDDAWSGSSMDFILLAFAVTSPISAAIGMAFHRRERALINIGNFRSFSYHLYLAHALWDWTDDGGREAAAENFDFLEHCDAVLAQIVGIGDELSRFLTLPSASRSRHRLTRQGRREAARTMEAAYYLLKSMAVQWYVDSYELHALLSSVAKRLSQAFPASQIDAASLVR